MNIKLKFSLIILITLILGIAIGFEISEISIKMHMKEIRSFREANGFVNMFEDLIKPDADQKPLVSSILLKYHKIIDSTSKAGMVKVSELVDSMRAELKKSLKEDQIERLEGEIERMKYGPPLRPGMDPNRGPNPGLGPNGMNPPGDKNMHPPFNQENKLLRPEGNRPPNNPPPGMDKR